MIRKGAVILGLLWLGAAHGKDTQECYYELDPARTTFEFTAYKTTEKVPVKGTFNNITYQGKRKKKLLALLLDLKTTIDTLKVNTQNPVRDQTLRTEFFEVLKPHTQMEVSFVRILPQKNKATVRVRWNNMKAQVPMSITKWSDEHVTLKAEFKAEKFKLAAALASIHKACYELHKGKDGISKTWDEFRVQWDGHFKKRCAK